jgi:hypothetical protein
VPTQWTYASVRETRMATRPQGQTTVPCRSPSRDAVGSGKESETENRRGIDEREGEDFERAL